jgi:O-acetyl-ADP-ribose deacetylase (regulator of RNase III)
MTTIRVHEGDITRFPADAIGNAANESLVGGGGVDGAIHRAGGPAVMADLEQRYGRARHCPTGRAVVSAAGDLPARVVIHAVGPVWSGGGRDEPELLASAYRTSLELAAAEGCRTVALPAISTGVYGYPIEEAAEVAIRTVRTWVADHPEALDEVTFVLFSGAALEVFERALATRED